MNYSLYLIYFSLTVILLLYTCHSHNAFYNMKPVKLIRVTIFDLKNLNLLFLNFLTYVHDSHK